MHSGFQDIDRVMATVVYQAYYTGAGSVAANLTNLQVIRDGVLRQIVIALAMTTGAAAGTANFEVVHNASGQVFANVDNPTRLAVLGTLFMHGPAATNMYSVTGPPVAVNRQLRVGDILSGNVVSTGTVPTAFQAKVLFYVDER